MHGGNLMNRFLKLILAISLILALCFNAIGCELLGSLIETPDMSDTDEGDESGSGDKSPTGDGSGSQTGDGNGSQTGDGSGSQTGDGSGSQTGDGNGSQTGDGNGSQTGDGNGSQTGGNGDSGNAAEDKVVYNDITVGAFGGFTVPAYSGTGYYVLNNNVPFFTESEIVSNSYETYGNLDSLGRVTTAISCLGKELLPTGERGNIGSVYPTGWVQASYSVIPGGYLYNRCHLIGWQLTAEDANRQNLMTGTPTMNKTMLGFENQIADHLKEMIAEYGNGHIMYRITPVFTGNNLVADGVIMEAYSVEDEGEKSFCVFVYNVQPDVHIDYATGESRMVGTPEKDDTAGKDDGNGAAKCDYVLNTNSKKIHEPDCTHVSRISDKNKEEYNGYIEDLLKDGYTKCGTCNPE